MYQRSETSLRAEIEHERQMAAIHEARAEMTTNTGQRTAYRRLARLHASRALTLEQARQQQEVGR
jgi:hypothetical protein